MKFHPWLVFAFASTLAAVLLGLLFAWPDPCRYPIWSEPPFGELTTVNEGGWVLRAFASGSAVTVCGRPPGDTMVWILF